MNPMGVVIGIFMLLILCFFWSETFWSALIWLLRVTAWALLLLLALGLIFGVETGIAIWVWVLGIGGAILLILGILLVGSFVLDMVSDRPGCK